MEEQINADTTASTYTPDTTAMQQVLTTKEMKTMNPAVKGKMMKHFADMKLQQTKDSIENVQLKSANELLQSRTRNSPNKYPT